MSAPVDPSAIFVIVPAFNEATVIGDVLSGLISTGYRIVVVDDGSAINVQEYLSDLPVTVLRHRINLGQGAALQTGIRYALENQAAYLVTFDADGQHLPADIPLLIEPLSAGKTDITLGSRFISSRSQVPGGRKRLLKMARFFNYLFTGLLLSDAHNGLRAMNAEAASSIRIRQNGMAHATEIIAEIRKKQLRYMEVPVTVRYTDYSKKKGQTIWGSFRIFFDLLLNKIVK